MHLIYKVIQVVPQIYIIQSTKWKISQDFAENSILIARVSCLIYNHRCLSFVGLCEFINLFCYELSDLLLIVQRLLMQLRMAKCGVIF